MQKLKGVKLSPGKALAPAFRYERNRIPIPGHKITPEMVEKEISRLHESVTRAGEDLSQLRDLIHDFLDESAAGIIEGQLLILKDPSLMNGAIRGIRSNLENAAMAIDRILREYQELLSKSESAYQQERSIDLRDVRRRILGYLLASDEPRVVYYFNKPHILIADSLLPSDFMLFNPGMIAGIATREGGITSHVAILAREFGIPFVSNIEIDEISDTSSTIAIDADGGALFFDLSSEEENAFLALIEKERAREEITVPERDSQTGQLISVMVNLGFSSEMEAARKLEIAGVGLFRTEFLCLEQNRIPDEATQYRLYREIAHALAPRPVIFRTFDFGLDKFLNIFDLRRRQSPRKDADFGGIRLALAHPGIFITQIRALLQAAETGNLRIMFPMVRTAEEIEKAGEYILRTAGEMGMADDIPPLGAMIETREAVDNLDNILNKTDFISIGTNDLLRYLHGINREKATGKEYLSPAFLQVVYEIVRKAKSSGKEVSICGEAAAEPAMIPLLVAMGVNSISVNLTALSSVREVLAKMSRISVDFPGLLRKTLRQKDAAKAENLISRELKGVFPDEK